MMRGRELEDVVAHNILYFHLGCAIYQSMVSYGYYYCNMDIIFIWENMNWIPLFP